MDAFLEALLGAVLKPLAHLLGTLLSPLLAFLGEALLVILDGLFSVVVEWTVSLLLQLLVVPVACILSTPFVLIGACFDPGSYFVGVVTRYHDLCSRVWWWN